MVAELAVDPRAIVSDVGDRSHQSNPVEAPSLLRHAVGTPTPLPSIRDDPRVLEMHDEWASAHDQPAPVGSHGRVRRRVAAVVREEAGPAQAEDRALIGSVIRATDAVAARCDELASRLAELESLVEEVVTVLSEDLVRLRAAVVGARDLGPGGGKRPSRTGAPRNE
jgi:hypothetical protein